MTPRVEFQPTPNPDAGKFVVGRPVTPDGESRSFHSLDDAQDHPVAQALLQLDGVRSVFMVSDFITVSKTPAADWEVLAPSVREILDASREGSREASRGGSAPSEGR